MAPWTFHSAGSLTFGRGAAAKAGEVARRLRADRAFVVTDATLAGNGVLDAVRGPLQAAGVTVTVFDGCVPEPPSDVVYAATEAARKAGGGLVVGLGGGSNMDTAKLVALLLAHGGTLDDYVGDCRVPGPVGPMLCLPTTAGTGSEVSPAAVYTDTAKGMKVSCLSNYLRPAAAIVDPLLTVKCPPKVTADSGIDALTHAIEAYTAVDHDEFVKRPPGGETVYQGRNGLSQSFAIQCIGLVADYLRAAVECGDDLESREGMALAGTLGGLAFSNAGVALTHAMEYPVGAAVHVSHGAGNGLLLPHVMRFNRATDATSFGAVGFTLGGLSPLGDDAAERVEQLCREVGIPARLRDIGVTEDMLPGFADKAFAVKRLMRVNPRMPQSADELLAVYRAAF